jgi:hypothetical protein
MRLSIIVRPVHDHPNQNTFTSEHGFVPDNQAVDRVDLFHFEEEEGVSQLVTCLRKTQDNLDHLSEGPFRQSFQMLMDGMEVAPAVLDK